jgi:hypothetical protein
MAPFLALEPITPVTLAEHYQTQVRQRHGVESIEVDQAAALIEEVAEVIQPRYGDFMEDVLAKISAMLKSEGWA